MSRKKKKQQPVEVRIAIGGLDLVATSNQHSASFDRLLEQWGAESFVFVPLVNPGKQLRRVIGNREGTARQKAKLPAGDWYEGELRTRDDDVPVPGVLAFDIRRSKAREIAGELGVKQFLWGTSGAPVEQHAVKIFQNDTTHTWKSMRSLAFKGLLDMLDTARNIAALSTAVEESQTNIQKFWQLVAVVLGIAITAGAMQAFAVALFGSSGSESWLATIIKILFYPFVLPAILVGVYLRVLVSKGEQEARDFTAVEAAANWHKVAPHLLALWMLCWSAILLLTWVQSVPGTDIPFFGRTSSVTTSFIVCVWMLLPIANSNNMKTLVGSALEAAIAAALSIFTIKLSLYVTNLLSDVLWDVIMRLAPFDIPERLQQVINYFINIGAEVFFVAVLLGYAWARTRQQFTRL